MTNEKTLPTGFKAVGVIRRSNNFTLPPINWTLWGSMYDVELWQAAALSLNINPDTIKDPTKFNHGNFKDRLRLLENWLPKKNRLMLCELAGKWSKISEWDIPLELAALARFYSEPTITEAAAPATPAAKVKGGAGTPPCDDWTEKARTIADECFDHDTKMKCRDSLKGYCGRVMGIMQECDIKGPRGIIDNQNTIMREALQGKKWWANKSK